MMLDANDRPMVAVHTCSSETEAEIVLSILREHEIVGRINSSLPQALYPMVTVEVTVLVSEDQADAARAFLATFPKPDETATNEPAS